MAEHVQNNTLQDRHYVTLILRCSFDVRGCLIGGECVDTRYSLPEHFLGEVGLTEALSAWLRQQRDVEGGVGQLQQGA